MTLERLISSDPAVRRELERFERMQIWITDPKIEDLADAHMDRMKDEFGTTSIPLHVIVDSEGNELERFDYRGPDTTAADYLEFLKSID